MVDNNSNDIPSVDEIRPSKPIQPNEEKLPNPSRSFQSYMKGEEAQKPSEQVSNPSPFDLASQGSTALGPITNESIVDQMNSTSSALGDLQNQLNNKKLKLRPSQKYLLRSKLTNANKSIRNAANKTGVDTGSPPTYLSHKNPVSRLLSLVTDSQQQLALAQERVHTLSSQKKTLSPADYLLMQVNLTKAQQELEYSSVLLSVTVSGIKTLFNIQI